MSAMPPSLPKERLRPLIVIFIGLIGFGAYAVMSGHEPGPEVHGALPSVPNVDALQKESRLQQRYLLARYRGESTDAVHNALVTRIGMSLIRKTEAKDSKINFHFHVLAEPDVIDSFALPVGDVYVTTALVNRMRTEGELAAVLAGGIAHVLAGDKLQSPEPVPDKPDAATDIKLHFTAEQEAIADDRALKMMAEAGYNPQSMLSMFRVLTDAYNAGAQASFFATHPSDSWRLTNVANAIAAMYPQGVPAELSK